MRSLVLAILQMVLGVLTILSSWGLGQIKTRIVTLPSGMVGNVYPQNCILEFVLVFLSLVTTTCGYFQLKGHVKYASSQMALGLVIVIISTPLGIRAASIPYEERSNLYYLAYVITTLGVVVFTIGFLQVLTAVKGISQKKR